MGPGARRRPGGKGPARTIGLALAVCCATQLIAAQPGEPRILFPVDQAVIDNSRFVFIALTPPERPELRVDGVVRPWEPFNPPVSVARLELGPGEHVLSLGEDRLTIFVSNGGPGRPEGWPTVRPHPLIAGEWKQCNFCHEVSTAGGRIQLGEFQGFEACYHCHTSVDFWAIHAHPEEPLLACDMCHAIHGSSRPYLLRAPSEQLCTECHD